MVDEQFLGDGSQTLTAPLRRHQDPNLPSHARCGPCRIPPIHPPDHGIIRTDDGQGVRVTLKEPILLPPLAQDLRRPESTPLEGTRERWIGRIPHEEPQVLLPERTKAAFPVGHGPTLTCPQLGVPSRAPPGDTLARIVQLYAAACERSRAAVNRCYSLGHLAAVPSFGVGPVNLRWILVHMIDETARHTGHLDLLRDCLVRR